MRFLTMDQVAEQLATSRAQVYALVRSGELPALKIGGRGQWRVECDRLEAYIAQATRTPEPEWNRTTRGRLLRRGFRRAWSRPPQATERH